MKTHRASTFARLLFSATLVISLSSCQTVPLGQPTAVIFDEYISTGDTLPIENITTIDGDVINLQQLGKKKLIVLFASWCSDSNRLITALNDSPLLDDKSIDIIAIAREEDKETIEAWRDNRGVKIAIAVDRDRSIYKRFASGGIPRLITVGENNKIIKMNLAEGVDQLTKIVWK